MKKKALFLLFFALTSLIYYVSCGPNAKELEEKAKQDSIAKIDSMSNNFTGKWIDIKNTYPCRLRVTISRNGESFIVEESTKNNVWGSEATYSATLQNGQLITSHPFFKEIMYIPATNNLTWQGKKLKRE